MTDFRIFIVIPLILILIKGIAQPYPEIDLNSLSAQDDVFTRQFEPSKNGELTIMSFNIRDVRGTNRTLEDFQVLSSMIENADIIVFQELGAKGFSNTFEKNQDMMQRIDAMIAVYKTYLGSNWDHEIADVATPDYLGPGAEIPLVLFRKSSNEMDIDVNWKGYHDLGDKRDMGIFEVFCTKENSTQTFTIGSVHTKPSCPERGSQLIAIGKYAEDNVNNNFVLLGDFNFGYKSSCENGYEGENFLRNLHNTKKAFLVFNDISYDGNGDDSDFRTNLNLRKSTHMYDQFLVSNSFASKMADGGSLTNDCGWIAFSTEQYFEDIMEYEAKSQMKGFKKAMKYYGESTSSSDGKALINSKTKEIELHYTTVDAATYHLSDHKPIWLQLKLF